MHVLFVQCLLEGTDFGYVSHASGSRAIYQRIALELGYKLVQMSYAQFIRSMVTAKNVNFSERGKLTFFTFAGRSLRPNLAREARLDAF